MTKISLLTLALLSIASPSLAQNHDARSAFAAMRCDITDERAVEWVAIGQKVTLKTTINRTAEHDFPTGRLLIILEDGTEIDLGQGSKYFDDGPIEDLIDCQKHLSSAVGATLASLSGNGDYHPTLKSLWDNMEYGKDCVDAQGQPKDKDNASIFECQQAFYLHELFTRERPHSELSDQELTTLRDSGAPLITITRSGYYSETAVYDANANKIHVLYSDGC